MNVQKPHVGEEVAIMEWKIIFEVHLKPTVGGPLPQGTKGVYNKAKVAHPTRCAGHLAGENLEGGRPG